MAIKANNVDSVVGGVIGPAGAGVIVDVGGVTAGGGADEAGEPQRATNTAIAPANMSRALIDTS